MMEKYCCLCVTKNSKDLMDIFDESGKQFNIEQIIYQHFGVKLTASEDSADSDKNVQIWICTNCWMVTNSFHLLYIKVQLNKTDMQFTKSIITEETNIVDYVKKEEYDQFDGPPEEEYDNRSYLIKAEPLLVVNTLDDDCEFISEQNNTSDCDDNAVAKDFESDIDSIQQNTDTDTKTKKLRTKRKLLKKNYKDCDNFGVVDDEKIILHKNSTKKLIKSINKKKKDKKISSSKRKNKTKDEITIENQQISYYFQMKCNLCDKNLINFLDARSHYTRAHQQAGYLMCCNKKYFDRSRAMDHIRQHLNPDAFKCLECNKSYVDKYALKNHMESHAPMEQRQFKCDICSNSFTKLYKLSQHFRQAHSSKKERKFQCNKCDKSFPTKCLLAQHVRGVHEFANAHICHICAKTFKSKQVYELHQREHMDIQTPRLQCKICGAWLKHEHSLRKHMYRHTDGEAICTLCNKVTSNRDALGEHMRYVHMERSHKCSVCEKSFKKSINLKEHMAYHTGEDLYTCPYCPKTFKSSANMHGHRKKTHPKEWQSDRDKRQAIKDLNLSKIIN